MDAIPALQDDENTINNNKQEMNKIQVAILAAGILTLIAIFFVFAVAATLTGILHPSNTSKVQFLDIADIPPCGTVTFSTKFPRFSDRVVYKDSDRSVEAVYLSSGQSKIESQDREVEAVWNYGETGAAVSNGSGIIDSVSVALYGAFSISYNYRFPSEIYLSGAVNATSRRDGIICSKVSCTNQTDTEGVCTCECFSSEYEGHAGSKVDLVYNAIAYPGAQLPQRVEGTVTVSFRPVKLVTDSNTVQCRPIGISGRIEHTCPKRDGENFDMTLLRYCPSSFEPTKYDDFGTDAMVAYRNSRGKLFAAHVLPYIFSAIFVLVVTSVAILILFYQCGTRIPQDAEPIN